MKNSVAIDVAAACVSVAALLITCSPAVAFTPQHDPLNAQWLVEGFMDMFATAILYVGDLAYFRVQIGDTSWDETMPRTAMQFQVAGG